MNIIVQELGKWFYCYENNYLSDGSYILLNKYDGKPNGCYTYNIELICIEKDFAPYKILQTFKNVIDARICICNNKSAIYRLSTSVNCLHIFFSTETEKIITKRPYTTVVPWKDKIIICEPLKDNSFCDGATYSCYDFHFNLLWEHTEYSYINDGAYRIFENFIEIGEERSIYFDESGYLDKANIKGLRDKPLVQSDWYKGGDWYSFLEQTGEKCIAITDISDSLLNGKEYVLQCHNSRHKYLVKLDQNLKLVWKIELPYCTAIMQTLYSKGIYYSIGEKEEGSFCITAFNEKGEILEESENITAAEFCGHIIGGKLVVFYNRTDNLNKTEKQLLKDGVRIANGYCLIAK